MPTGKPVRPLFLAYVDLITKTTVNTARTKITSFLLYCQKYIVKIIETVNTVFSTDINEQVQFSLYRKAKVTRQKHRKKMKRPASGWLRQ